MLRVLPRPSAGRRTSLWREWRRGDAEYIADVIAYDEVTQTALLQVKNHFRPHIEAEVFGPHTPSTRFEIGDVCDLEGRPLEVLNQPMQMVRMKCSLPLEEHAMIRKVYDRSGRHVY
ncbi:MAG: U32 family peptidase C-terminal domain-containing protein [Merdibacter sp.]